MGEKIAPAAASAELPRMETPREALGHGVPPAPIRAGSTPTPATSPANGHAAAIAPTEVPPTVEKAYSDQIIENAPEAISIIDLDLKILRINAEFTNLFGFTAAEAVGKRLDHADRAARSLCGNRVDRPDHQGARQAKAGDPPPAERRLPG